MISARTSPVATRSRLRRSLAALGCIPVPSRAGRLELHVGSGEGGIRTLPKSPAKTALSAQGGAESGARTPANPNLDPGLASLIDAWPNLPEPIRAAIRALVGSAKGPS